MIYSDVKNLVWCGEDKTAFDCTVNFETLGVVPFTCNVADTVAHAQDIWNRAISGEFGEILDCPFQDRQIQMVDVEQSNGIPKSIL